MPQSHAGLTAGRLTLRGEQRGRSQRHQVVQQVALLFEPSGSVEPHRLLQSLRVRARHSVPAHEVPLRQRWDVHCKVGSLHASAEA